MNNPILLGVISGIIQIFVKIVILWYRSIIYNGYLDTFAKRKTQISQSIPYAFTSDFYLDVQKILLEGKTICK